jgi:16S rRNA (adenine1518-N6/adenine1519-N6)-dimethyltransferase
MATLYEEVRAALSEGGFKPKKRLGQNFLIHEPVVASILRLLELTPQDEIMEIGPGLGVLTRRLVEHAARVWAIEVDTFLVNWLQRAPWGKSPKFRLVHGDILKVPLEEILPPHRIKLVANLPYSIATPVLFRLFRLRHHFSLLLLMVQREVADRIAGRPGTKAYGTLSVWSQLYGKIVDRVPVSPEAFYPRPKVRSTIIKFEFFSEPLAPGPEIPLMELLIRSAFAQRRKTLGNALASGFGRDRDEIARLLREAAVDPKRRGETLNIKEFIRLARAIKLRGLASLDE